MTTQLYHDVKRTNFINKEPVLVTGVKANWTANIPRGNTKPPIIDARNNSVFVASGKGRVHAIDLETGEGKWRSPILGEPGAEDKQILTPFLSDIVKKDHLFVTVLDIENSEADGSLAIIDKDDGERMESFSDRNYVTEGLIAPDLESHFFVRKPGWVTSIRTDKSYHLDYNRDEFFDTDHGFPTYDDMSRPVGRGCPHLTAEDHYVLAAADNTLFVYNIRQEEVEVTEFGPSDSSHTYITPCITVDDGTAYIPISGHSDDDTAHRLIAYDYTGGLREWSVELPWKPKCAVATNFETVYISDQQSVFAFDAESGEERWSYEVKPLAMYPVLVQPIVTDNTVFTHYATGMDTFGLLALNADDGTERWRYQYDHDSPPATYPAFAGHYVVYRTEDGTVNGLQLEFESDDEEETTVKKNNSDQTTTNSTIPATGGEGDQGDGDDTPETIICPECSAQQSAEENFCSACGTELPINQCSACDASVDPDDAFCSNCGTKLD